MLSTGLARRASRRKGGCTAGARVAHRAVVDIARGSIPDAADLALPGAELPGGGSAPMDMLCDIPAGGMVLPNLY